MNLDIPVRFNDKLIEGPTAKGVISLYLSQYGGLTENKRLIVKILRKLDNDEELNETEVEILEGAWDKACEDDRFQIPLMYDVGISKILGDDNDVS